MRWFPRDTIDAESAARLIPDIYHKTIYLTGGMNSCLNPLLYGAYYYSISKSNRRSNTEATGYAKEAATALATSLPTPNMSGSIRVRRD